jgi:hypothetical protein
MFFKKKLLFLLLGTIIVLILCCLCIYVVTMQHGTEGFGETDYTKLDYAKALDNIDLEYHDDVENIRKSDHSNILDDSIQVMVYGKQYNYNKNANDTLNLAMDLTVGASLEVNSQGKGIWLAGTIAAVNSDGTYDIQYSNPDSTYTSLSQIPTPLNADTTNIDSQLAYQSKVNVNPTPLMNTSSPVVFTDDLYKNTIAPLLPAPTYLSTIPKGNITSPPTRASILANYDPSLLSIQHDSNGNITSIIEKSVDISNLRQLVSIPYNKVIGFSTYNSPGYFAYGSTNYVPSYSDSVYLSRSLNFLPKSAYA